MCNLTLQRDFSMALAWTRDAGITDKIWHDMFDAEAKLRRDAGPKLHVDNRLNMNHMIPSFIVFGIGLATSVVAFGLEGLLNNGRARARRRHRRANRPPRSRLDATQRRKKAWEAHRHLKSAKQAPDGPKSVEKAPESE